MDPPTRRDALSDLYRSHAPRVARWARHLGGPGIDAEDVVHEVFLIVHDKLDGVRDHDDDRLSGWIYRITANVVRDRRRHERRLRRRETASGELPRPQVPTPVEELERQQSTALLYRLLDDMRDQYRDVLILFEIEHLAGEEVASLLNVNLKTVWVWLHRGRAQLRERLERWEAQNGRA